MELGSIEKLLKKSPYKAHAKEIQETFEVLGVKTITDLDNAPRHLPGSLFGYSPYQVVRYIREAAIDQELSAIRKPEPEPEPEPEPQAEPEPVAEALEELEDKES